MTASRIVVIFIAIIVVVGTAYVFATYPFATYVALVASGVVIGASLIVFAACAHVNRPNHRLIVRDAYDHIVDWPDGRLVLVSPLGHKVAESFDLGWRQALLQDVELSSMEGLMLRTSVQAAFTVDPAQMQTNLRQMVIDRFGADETRWREFVERTMRAGLNYLLLQRTYAELMSPQGQAGLRHDLTAWIAAMAGGMGVAVQQVMILQVCPTQQLADIIGDAVRRRATVEYIRDQVLPLLPALLPYTSDPLRALTAISMADCLSNRQVGPVTLNLWQANDGVEDGRRPALPAPRSTAYFPVAAMSRRR